MEGGGKKGMRNTSKKKSRHGLSIKSEIAIEESLSSREDGTEKKRGRRGTGEV